MKIYFILFIFFFCNSSYAEEKNDYIFKKERTDSLLWRKTNTFFIEAGGYSLISANYDKIILVKQTLKISARIGFSVLPGNKHKGKNTLAYLIPIGLNAFWGKSRHHFQTGIGELYINAYAYPDNNTTLETENINILTTFLFLGYRYQKSTGGIFFQTGWTPALIEFKNNNINLLANPFLGGISIGYGFLDKHFRQ